MCGQAEEAKQRRKDEKKAAKAAAEVGSDDEGSDAGEGFDGIRAVLAARATTDRADVKMVDTGAASEEEDEEVPAKKARKGGADMPDIDDEEFTKLQEKLFGDKAKSKATTSPKKGRAAGKTRKAR